MMEHSSAAHAAHVDLSGHEEEGHTSDDGARTNNATTIIIIRNRPSCADPLSWMPDFDRCGISVPGVACESIAESMS